MPSLKLFHRDPDRPSLRQRAEALKASAARVIRRRKPLPAPGSEEAQEAFRVACRETDRLAQAARDGYPDLRCPDGTMHTKHSLGGAFGSGDLAPAEYAHLYRQAAEREHRIETAAVATDFGALWALAFPEEAGRAVPGREEGYEAADAKLLRLGDQLDRAHTHWRVMEERNREPTERMERALKGYEASGGPTADQIIAAWQLPGVTEAHAAAEDAFSALDPICEAIWGVPATTAVGLAVKARAALVHIWASGDYEADAALGDEEDIPAKPARRLIEACCALAGVDWRGDPVAPIALIAPDPTFAQIEAHRAAYADYERAWLVWREMIPGDSGREEAEAAFAEPQRVEARALDALIAARPATLAGIRALAEYLPGAIRQVNSHTDEGDGERALRSLAAALAALAPVHVAHVTADEAEGESAAALIAAIKAEWAAYGAMEAETADPASEAAHDAAFGRLSALLKAAAALPVNAHGAILAKALALAWIEHTELWESGRPRDDYATDGKLVFDIRAAIMGAPVEPRSDDADLLALEAEFRQADREHDAAVAALSEARDRYVGPPMPKELRVWRFDWIHTAIPRPRIVTTEGGTRTLPYGEEEVEQMRGLRCVRPSYGSAGEMGPDGVRVVPDTQVQERVDGIVAAWDRWQAEIRAAEAALELPGLRAARDAAEDRRIAFLERVRETPARTLAGLGAKARVAAAVIGVEDVRAEGRDGFTADDPAALPYELVADLLALTGTTGA